jgi:hypothetical protein
MGIILSYNENPWRQAMINASSSYVPPTLGIPGFHFLDGKNTTGLFKDLKKSWAYLFRNLVLILIPGEEVARKCFCSTNGRPCKDMTTTIGLMIIQEMFNYTDSETVHALRTNIEVMYALRIDTPDDNKCRMTRETFWAHKEKIRSKGLYDMIFDRVTMGLVKMHDVDTSHMRMDSVNISSNIKHLTRGGLFLRSIDSFLNRLKKGHRGLFNSIDDSILSKYLKPKTGYDFFGGVKPAARPAALKSMAEDVLLLVRKFQDDQAVAGMTSFQNLVRLLSEQCTIVDDNGGEKVQLKEPKEVPADSLQSPFDPDAGYDRHKPEGRYQVQLAETFEPAGETEEDSKGAEGLRLVLYHKTESAAISDSHALLPAIDSLEEKDAKPEVMLADSTYGGQKNVEDSLNKGVRVFSQVPGGKKSGGKDGSDSEESSSASLTLADFEKDGNNGIISCPAGQQADTAENKAGEGYISAFDLEKCKACPFKDKCPVKVGKRKASITYTEKAAKIADRRKSQESLEFKKLYRKRSGIEATNSELARRYRLKRLRLRGKKAVANAVAFKVLGMNIRRTVHYVSKKRC